MIGRRSYSPIGVDITTRAIRAVQLVRRRSAWRLHTAIVLPRDGAPLDGAWTPPTDAEHERLCGVLQRRGFEGTDVVLSVPADRTITSVIELPPRTSGAPIGVLAAAELGRVHKVDAPTLQVAYWEVPTAGRSNGTIEYMVAGCTEQSALELIDPFERVGLRVQVLDVRALSLHRACEKSMAGAGRIEAILCLGWNHTTLLFVVDGVLTFQRTLDGVDGRTLATAAAAKLRVDAASVVPLILRHAAVNIDAAAPSRREIERELAGSIAAHVEDIASQFGVSCAYIARRYPDRAATSVSVTGEFGSLPGLVERLERPGFAARRFAPGDAVDIGSFQDPTLLGTEFAATLGLAMRPLRGAA